MNKHHLSILFRVITALVAWFALSLQLYILISNTPGNGMTSWEAVARFFIFFTILSNLLVAASLTITLLIPYSKAGRYFSKPSVTASIALYILIVGLVYNSILRNLWSPAGLQRLADELLHVAVPVFYFLSWLFFAPKQGLQFRHAFYWLSFPAIYIVYALLRGKLEGFYPYPFIDVNKLGYGTVAINSLGMMLAFIITGSLLILLAKNIRSSGTGTKN